MARPHSTDLFALIQGLTPSEIQGVLRDLASPVGNKPGEMLQHFKLFIQARRKGAVALQRAIDGIGAKPQGSSKKHVVFEAIVRTCSRNDQSEETGAKLVRLELEARYLYAKNLYMQAAARARNVLELASQLGTFPSMSDAHLLLATVEQHVGKHGWQSRKKEHVEQSMVAIENERIRIQLIHLSTEIFHGFNETIRVEDVVDEKSISHPKNIISFKQVQFFQQRMAGNIDRCFSLLTEQMNVYSQWQKTAVDAVGISIGVNMFSLAFECKQEEGMRRGQEFLQSLAYTTPVLVSEQTFFVYRNAVLYSAATESFDALQQCRSRCEADTHVLEGKKAELFRFFDLAAIVSSIRSKQYSLAMQQLFEIRTKEYDYIENVVDVLEAVTCLATGNNSVALYRARSIERNPHRTALVRLYGKLLYAIANPKSKQSTKKESLVAVEEYIARTDKMPDDAFTSVFVHNCVLQVVNNSVPG
jgi:hypothetical protein